MHPIAQTDSFATMPLTCLLVVQGTGLIQPGEQLTQLLLAAAAQLTSLMVGAIPLSRENTGGEAHTETETASAFSPLAALCVVTCVRGWLATVQLCEGVCGFGCVDSVV